MKKTLILIKKHRSVNNLIPFFIILFLIPFYALLYKIFSVRALSFGCFDDCANYVTGYFMTLGKRLYSDVSFNHILGMSYLSYVVQKFHHSINIYDLVLTHRKIILLISFIFDFLLIFRFRLKGLIFIILYELTKFYIFGDRFLGESIVVYACVYLFGLVLNKLQNKQIKISDFAFSGFLCWLIIFMREPYIPLGLLLFCYLLVGKKITKEKFVALIIFSALLILTVLSVDMKELYFNDVTVNLLTSIKAETQTNKILGSGMLIVFFYPVFMLFYGIWNNFNIYLILVDLVFLAGMIKYFLKKKTIYMGLVILLFLGVANLRPVIPGRTYYEGYHMLVWYGMFLFLSVNFISDFFNKSRKIGLLFFAIIFSGWVIAVFAPGSYIYDKIDLQEQLLTNFGKEMNIGTVIHNLSSPSDTLFLDGADDLIYWQADLKPSYKYSWYTAIMPQIQVYRDARIEMFKKNPPDFYYDFCSPKAPEHPSLPKFIKNSYQQLYENGKKSCLYIKKTKLQEITSEQWDKARQGFFTLPPSKK